MKTGVEPRVVPWDTETRHPARHTALPLLSHPCAAPAVRDGDTRSGGAFVRPGQPSHVVVYDSNCIWPTICGSANRRPRSRLSSFSMSRSQENMQLASARMAHATCTASAPRS